jgi:cytochrome oxidase Cu insertion factor (SCO1/SenC/PrrC family)
MKPKTMRNYLINPKRYTPFLSNSSSVGFLVLLAAVISLCFACEDAERTTQIITSPEEGAEALPSGEGLDRGALAPDFSLPDSTGNTHNLSQYRGQNLVIVFYRTGT